MKVLVVFEMVPEETVLLLVEDPTEDELQTLRGAAGQYINDSDDTACVEQINEWYDADRFAKPDPNKPVEGPFDLVVVCGFVL